MNLVVLLILVLFLCGGLPPLGFHQYVGGYPQYYGGGGALLVLIVVILLFSGRLNF